MRNEMEYLHVHRSLNVILRNATDEQLGELAGWIECTALGFLPAAEHAKREKSINEGCWIRWLKLRCRWFDLGSESLKPGNPIKYYRQLKASQKDLFGGLLDDPQAVWRELDSLEGGACHE